MKAYSDPLNLLMLEVLPPIHFVDPFRRYSLWVSKLNRVLICNSREICVDTMIPIPTKLF